MTGALAPEAKTNKTLWNRVCTTDPAAVKPITGKQYKGNSPKPYWIVERLTDVFGPCGIGWGFTILSERFERFTDVDTLHVACIRFWYMLDGHRGELEQLGQTKASYKTSKGDFLLDEDAPKKSVTDALVKCASYLGFAGDIFSGRWDDSQYVAAAGKEWDAAKAEARAEARADKAKTRGGPVVNADEAQRTAKLNRLNALRKEFDAIYNADRTLDAEGSAANTVTRFLHWRGDEMIGEFPMDGKRVNIAGLSNELLDRVLSLYEDLKARQEAAEAESAEDFGGDA